MPSASHPLAVFASFSGSGGVERMLINLIRGFVDLGQPVDLVLVRAAGSAPRAPAGVGETGAIGRPPHPVRRPGAGPLPARTPARGALLAAKDRAGRTAVLARALAGSRTPITMRLGTNLSTAMAGRPAIDRWLRYLPIRLLYPRIDQIIAVSAGVADDTARIARLPRQSIQVIRNPVITPELAAQAAQPCPHPWLADPAVPVDLRGRPIGASKGLSDPDPGLRPGRRVGDPVVS